MRDTDQTRRGILTATLAAGVALAGCADGSAPSTPPGGTDTDEADVGMDMNTETTDELDLREANVIEVALESQGDGRYRFDVTLYHDDDGEDGYANWWQVESLDGARLGRRDLLHAHSTAPFTRSDTFEFPADTACVVVRGHDQTHGYGGQVMLVDIATGATSAVAQGKQRQSFSAADCP